MILAAAVFLLQTAVEYRYWIAPCDPKESECKVSDAELAKWAFEDWERASKGGLKFKQVSAKANAEIRVLWISQRHGLYGEARPILVNGRQGAELYIRPEMGGLGDDIADVAGKDPLFREAVVYLTCLHESGHALGLGHTSDFADIMYSFGYGGDIREYFARYRRKLKSRSDIRSQTGVSPADAARLPRKATTE